ncbi:unnamed protein product [Trichogramma brassicae]|uniref:Reverse transcriptase domain-containing protein n=1 Tax=Trichogramma brassicae TaxID=86971 RepID=A0A6H5IXP8_9HYME|nr:unnamed protein product [Trichogramma brassicae]
MTPERAMSCISVEGHHTVDWKTTMETLMEALFGKGDDSTAGEPSTNTQTEPAWERWTMTDLQQAIKKTKKGKAPGQDRIEAEMLIELMKSPVALDLLDLYNECRRRGYFPSAWKDAKLVTLLKSADKDVTNPKSYRPICLLSIISKTLERLINNSIKPVLLDQRYASDRQYGYREKRSTVNVIAEVLRQVDETPDKMLLAILFDVTGAFDNLKWTSIVAGLQKRNCPVDLLNLVKSYLSDRRVTAYGVGESVTLKLTKGCPQGSILGPSFWNLCADDLLEVIKEASGNAYMYADDLIVLVSGDSRRQIEGRAQPLVDKISKWFGEQELKISESKTEMVMLKCGKNAKGSLLKTGKGGYRPPTIKLLKKSIKYSDPVKYLGVTLGAQCKMEKHAQCTGLRAKRLFDRLAVICKARWGITFSNIRTLYKGVYLPSVLYAVEAWNLLLNKTTSKKMASAQRSPMLRMSKGYATASTHALQVICAAMPPDLETHKRYYKNLIKNNIAFTLGQMQFNQDDDKRQAISRLDNEILDIWQAQWNTSDKGDTTFEYFPDVKARMQKQWLEPDYFSTQFLTGHGDLNFKLKKLGLKEDDRCDCGLSETAEHVLRDCKLYEQERNDAVRQLSLEGVTTGVRNAQELTRTGKIFNIFKKLCKRILTKKEESRR